MNGYPKYHPIGSVVYFTYLTAKPIKGIVLWSNQTFHHICYYIEAYKITSDELSGDCRWIEIDHVEDCRQ